MWEKEIYKKHVKPFATKWSSHYAPHLVTAKHDYKKDDHQSTPKQMKDLKQLKVEALQRLRGKNKTQMEFNPRTKQHKTVSMLPKGEVDFYPAAIPNPLTNYPQHVYEENEAVSFDYL